ncbi:hypothetical protein BGZ74_004404, partial [Mortierella antarctica]
MLFTRFIIASLAILAEVALATELEMSTSQFCIHNDCLSGTNYCVIRYSYVKISTSGDVGSVKYVIPQDTPMTQAFNGKCIEAVVAPNNPN